LLDEERERVGELEAKLIQKDSAIDSLEAK
jgi:chromosome segregation ATPase